MSVIIQRLFYGPHPPIEAGLYTKQTVRVPQFFIPVIVFIILRFLRFTILQSFVISIGFYAYVYWTDNKEKDDKVRFLNELMYNDEIEPYNIQSYIGIDDDLLNFFYTNKDYADVNLNAYRSSMENVNNLLKMEFEIFQNVYYPTQLESLAKEQCEKALNNLHSLIHRIPSSSFSYETFNDNLATLKALLDKHMNRIHKHVAKKDISVYSQLEPADTIRDDTKTLDYSPNYSFF